MRRCQFLVILVCGLLFLLNACSEKVTPLDWPQFKKDNYRSGCIDAQFDISNFGKCWTFDTGQEPIPAWYGPAKADLWSGVSPLPSMRDYDLAYSPIIVGNSLYYASTADDAVYCHDARTGEKRWHFTTDGPVHISPTFYDGKLYVGSDDGYVYCLNARTGSLKWKYTPTPNKKKRIFNNGRFISFYPIRTGVLIEDGKAYFGASLLPWKKSYFCAIDAQTGEIGEEGTFLKEYDTNSMTLEGAMASTGELIIQPQGRIAPVFIKKNNGETEGSVAGAGGCFVLVTPDKNVIHGKTSRYVAVEETKVEEKQALFMTYNDGKEIIVKGDSSYVLNYNSLASYNRKTKKMNWLHQDFHAYRIIVAGDILFAGEDDKVEGISLINGQTVWKSRVVGAVYALSFARNRLYVSTSEGYLYAFGEGGTDAEYLQENIDKKPIIEDKKNNNKEETPSQELQPFISDGPYIQPFSVDSVVLNFKTCESMKVDVKWITGNGSQIFKAESEKKSHLFKLPVRKGKIYDYVLSTSDGKSATYNYDNFFNFYTRVNCDYPEAEKEELEEVKGFLNKYKVFKGLCLVKGRNSKETALALAKESPMQVVDVESSRRTYDRFIDELQERKSYNRKLTALKVEDEDNIPVVSEIADLVWVNDGEDADPDEVIRLIAPEHYGVIADLEDEKAWLAKSTLDWQVSVIGKEDNLFIIKKKPFENIGVWTHQHGDLRNASYGGESLFGSTQSDDFETQWMGRPGPRFITDRSGRKPSPLAVNGRMFMQGRERLIAINAFNGTLYWMKDIPGLVRMNMAHDCSNWACDSTYLFVVTKNYLLKIDQMTGKIEKKMNMKIPNDSAYHWGYVGVLPKTIIGSTTAKNAQFTSYHGNEGWYDASEGPLAYKGLSNRLFSVDKNTNKLEWEYIPKGVIINPTIVAYNDKLVFVESLSANRESRESGRGGDDLYRSTRMVALNIETGNMIYSQPFITRVGKAFYSMAANSGKCALVVSLDGEYDIHTFNIETGKEIWKANNKWFHYNHGGETSKPAIAGDRLVVKPYIYNIHTGERQLFNTPKAGHGCASYALTDNAMIYRGESCTLFDFNVRLFSKWERLRLGCWVSTIPAQGMILSPEGGGGCSCGIYYETSMAFAPISRTPVMIKANTEDSHRDYKDESWGDYYSSCNTNSFENQLTVELLLKPGLNIPIYYTTDGTEPTKESSKYREPIILTQSSEVKVAIYMEKEGKERRFSRSKYFNKVELKK